MQIFYMKKSSLKVLLVILAIVVLAVICYALFMPDHEPTLAEPIYQGDDSEKKVALAINVDWGEDIIPGCWRFWRKKRLKRLFCHRQICRKISRYGALDIRKGAGNRKSRLCASAPR